jgi:hypothetical protein
MEHIYNFDNLPPKESLEAQDGSKIKLKKGHLWIAGDLYQSVVGDVNQVYAVYYPNLKSILLAPETDQTFRQAHEVIMLFVKIKNANNDRSISIQEFIADNDIDESDRDLEYLAIPGVTFLKINL